MSAAPVAFSDGVMPQAAVRTGRVPTWALAWLALAFALSQLPVLLSACCAPSGLSGLGTVWFVNDFAQYELAMREGARTASWLVRDAFTQEPNQPAFMFPLYVALGKLSALTGLPAMALLRALDALAKLAFLAALWRFCQLFAAPSGAVRVALPLAIFGTGLGPIVGIVATLAGLSQPYVGNFSYELNTFGILFAAPHVAVGMAATLELARPLRGIAQPLGAIAGWWVALGAILALVHPFHVPVLLVALGAFGLARWRSHGRPAALVAAACAAIGATPALVPTVLTFSFDPFWGNTYTRQNLLPTPVFHELVVDLGVTLLAALAGLWFLRGRLAAPGLLLWVLLMYAAMYVPVPYQRRFSFGMHPAMVVLAANALVQLVPRARPAVQVALRAGVVILAGFGTIILTASVVASVALGAPLAVYRSTADLDAAARYLEANVRAGEVILADWDTSNYLAPRTDGSVVGGHPVATVRPDQKRFLIATYFAHGGDLAVARQLGADWVVYGAAQSGARRPEAPAAFQAGSVAVYRVPGPR